MTLMYTNSENGLNLSSTKINITTHDETNIRGFFLKSDLQQLLNKNGCVGIRFYNIVPTTGAPSLIAAAAKENGFEFIDKYLQSHDPSGSNLNMQAISLNRTTASERANLPPRPLQFMSYFSKNDMENILLNGNGDGLAFYEVTLENVDDADFNSNHTSFIQDNRATIKSHIAIPTAIVFGKLSTINDQFRNILSIHPCPGHCLIEDKAAPANNRVGSRAIRNVIPTSNDPYLFEW